MIMLKSKKEIGDYCCRCKKDFCHEDRIVLARNLKFFHFNCYSKKNYFYRLINSVETYFIWHESKVVIAELNDSLKKSTALLILNKKDKSTETEAGGGDTQIEMQLEVSKPMENPKKEETQNQAYGTVIDVKFDTPKIEEEQNQTFETTMDATLDDERVNELTSSLIEIRDEVEVLKSQIVRFEKKQDNDEQIIIQLEKALQRYRRNVIELNRQNYFLRQESVIFHQKLASENECQEASSKHS
ncbi:unnamed protein product [Chironomus riparius]|uniref:Uncharacterized protein n=1 Tax=Chironomus riparius TaxID=315576 RepID=A0A9N9WNH9_9DIPT|nr:unnamed protein product [Chironomus riparius]